jgi:hypothetical protein
MPKETQGKGGMIKSLKGIEPKTIISTNKKELMLKLVNTKIKDIFSQNISAMYGDFEKDHNKELINLLLKKDKCKNVINLTFIDCLNHFGGTKKFERLEGLETFSEEYGKRMGIAKDKRYWELFKGYVLNFEETIRSIRDRDANK